MSENVIQIQQAGSHVKARFRGKSGFVFGRDPGEAKSKLLFWELFNKEQKASKRDHKEKAA
jgi:hypothetical protein